MFLSGGEYMYVITIAGVWRYLHTWNGQGHEDSPGERRPGGGEPNGLPGQLPRGKALLE